MPSRTDHDPGRIRAFNDALRQHGAGGRMMLTSGVAALGATKVALVTEAVSCFAAFTPDNDPHGEHDVGSMEVADQIGYSPAVRRENIIGAVAILPLLVQL